ncbi:OsmC family protein [Sphingomonas sp. XXL09]|uniref:OsmC family protein n=1 Tax=Sphingomonas sp. XXL09 TaxID=3457787 RepID=UPI00406BB09A
MAKEHEYTCRIGWTGNRGDGTRTYRGYDRTWDVVTPGKPTIHCSNDPLLGGDPTLPNPEDLLLASLSSCHMLWYLHLASTAKIVVHRYTDDPLGVGEVHADGLGTDIRQAEAIHHEVHRYCFIARSVNSPVTYAPTFEIAVG